MGRLRPPWEDFVSSWKALGGVLRESWADLGTLLERLGGVLGALGSVLGRLLGHHGASRGPLGPSVAEFTRIKHFFSGMSSWKPFSIWILLSKIKA